MIELVISVLAMVFVIGATASIIFGSWLFVSVAAAIMIVAIIASLIGTFYGPDSSQTEAEEKSDTEEQSRRMGTAVERPCELSVFKRERVAIER